MSALPRIAVPDVEPTAGAPARLSVAGRTDAVPLAHGAPRLTLVDAQAPRAGQPLVRRPALVERLGAAGPVTVLSAPGAYGKTTLVRAWIAETGLEEQAAWITLRPGELTAERLLSGLKAMDDRRLLVIDDLHELRSSEAVAQLDDYLSNMPARQRVVLVTRAATGPGLHRLRLAGAVTELRPADLRFSPQETRELLNAAGVDLSDGGVAALHERCEGWVGGLRLAAGQLAGHADPERFAREFSGCERTVAGYLRTEGLDRQPPEVRDLLLRTSVLDRVSGPLADALAGASGSVRILQDLEEAGAFVTALDVGRSWFRYHPMLADLLRLELRRVNPALVATLHRAAGQWHERHGDVVEAIGHAQAAGDWSHATELLADHQLSLLLEGRTAAVRKLLGAFPAGAPAADAELALAAATAHAFDGLEDEAAAHLAVAEALSDALPDGRRQRFELGLAGTRLWLARLHGDAGRAAEAFGSTEAAVSAQPPGERGRSALHRATGLLNLGIAQLASLELEDGRRHLEQALRLARRTGMPYLEMSCLAYLALAAAHGGAPLSVARKKAEQAIVIAEAHGWDTEHDAAAPLAVAGMTLVWLGRFTEAERWLDRAQQALATGRAPSIEVLLHKARALLFLASDRFADALTALRAADAPHQALAGDHPLRLGLRGRALRAELEVAGPAAVRCTLAAMSADERRRPEVRLAAAALELAEERPEQALEELALVDEASAPAVYPGPAAIEALLLDAAAHDQLGDVRASRASLERALELAEPDGIVLPFALVPVGGLLERHRGHRTSHGALLVTVLDLLAGGSVQAEAAPLREPLSEAELRVVRHLPSNLKATEIAAELCVSPNTIRTHLRHIYAKLDAHTRNEAVTRARRLGLLAPRLTGSAVAA